MSTNRKNMAIRPYRFAGVGSEAVFYGQNYSAIATGNFDEAVYKVCAAGFATLKNVALFLAAPFVGLAYVLAFPFVGLGMAAWFGGKALVKFAVARKIAAFMKWAGTLVAAPLLGLALVTLLPFAGAVMLAWIGGRAVVE